MVGSYDAARSFYSTLDITAVELLRDTLRCGSPGRTVELARLTGLWIKLSEMFQRIDSKMDDIKRLTLAPILGFYIGDLVTTTFPNEDGFEVIGSAIVSNILVPYLSAGQMVDPLAIEFQVFLYPAEFIQGKWLSPQYGGSSVMAGNVEKLTSLIKMNAEAAPMRDALDINAQALLAGFPNRESIERVRLVLYEHLGPYAPCTGRDDVCATAALEQAAWLLYPQWRKFKDGDLVLAKFKDETSWRCIVFSHIDMQISRSGVLHYMDGEMVLLEENAERLDRVDGAYYIEQVDQLNCTKPIEDVFQMKMFMPRSVHEIASDGAVGDVLLAALVQRENLRAKMGRWSNGYKEPQHVAQRRKHFLAVRDKRQRKAGGNTDLGA